MPKQLCQVFFCASGLGLAKHLYSRMPPSAFLTLSSTSPVFFLVMSPVHLFRWREGTPNPCLLARYVGRLFFPVENQEACVEEDSLL